MQQLQQKPAKRERRSNEGFSVGLAACDREIHESMALRYDVFAREMGASLCNTVPGLDHDRFDPFCRHMIVRDIASGEVVASTRILADEHAARAGSFYSESEFDLTNIHALAGRKMEIGRTCVHRDFRNGAAITMLWSGLAEFMREHDFSYLMGCASICLKDGGMQAQSIMQHIREHSLAPAQRRVTPNHLYPPRPYDSALRPQMPPLLKAYLRLGAEIGGEPCWDRDFNVADVFVLLNVDKLSGRYARHFLGKAQMVS